MIVVGAGPAGATAAPVSPAGAAAAGDIVSGGQYAGSHLTQLYAARHLGVDFTPFDPGPGIT